MNNYVPRPTLFLLFCMNILFTLSLSFSHYSKLNKNRIFFSTFETDVRFLSVFCNILFCFSFFSLSHLLIYTQFNMRKRERERQTDKARRKKDFMRKNIDRIKSSQALSELYSLLTYTKAADETWERERERDRLYVREKNLDVFESLINVAKIKKAHTIKLKIACFWVNFSLSLLMSMISHSLNFHSLFCFKFDSQLWGISFSFLSFSTHKRYSISSTDSSFDYRAKT